VVEEEADDDENGDARKPPVNERIIPSECVRLCDRTDVERLLLASLEFVIILEATDDFLHQRMMNLPEKVVAGTHNTEAKFQRRLKAYHDLGDEGRGEKFFEDVDRPGETMSEASRSTFVVLTHDSMQTRNRQRSKCSASSDRSEDHRSCSASASLRADVRRTGADQAPRTARQRETRS
jgi:hypothetical protein